MGVNPYVGDIIAVGFNYAPPRWLPCDGRLIGTSSYPQLFQLLGTTYGGNGQTTFALPDLQGRVPVHQGPLAGGQNYVRGTKLGSQVVTLAKASTPSHSHQLPASASVASSASPVGAVPAVLPQGAAYAVPTDAVEGLNTNMTMAGQSQPHENQPPSLALLFIICVNGTYPSQG